MGLREAQACFSPVRVIGTRTGTIFLHKEEFRPRATHSRRS
jgi:hypothetical protein